MEASVAYLPRENASNGRQGLKEAPIGDKDASSEPDLGEARVDEGMAVAFGRREESAPGALQAGRMRWRIQFADELHRDESSVLLRARDSELDRDVALRILEGAAVSRSLVPGRSRKPTKREIQPRNGPAGISPA